MLKLGFWQLQENRRPNWGGNWPRPKQVIPRYKNSDPVMSVCSLQPPSSVPWPWRSHCVREADRPVTEPGERARTAERSGVQVLWLYLLFRGLLLSPWRGWGRGGGCAESTGPWARGALTLSRSTSQTEAGSRGLSGGTDPRWVCFALHLFLKFFLIGEKLLYNVVLLSAVQQSESVIPTHTSTLFLDYFST